MFNMHGLVAMVRVLGCSAKRSEVRASRTAAVSDRPSQMPRMPWYPSSFYASTRTWPFIARAVYRELLDVQWDAGGLPADPEALRTMVGVTQAKWRVAWPLVKQKFELDQDGQLRNQRLEEHRAYALKLTERRRDAANKRWAIDGGVIPLKLDNTKS